MAPTSNPEIGDRFAVTRTASGELLVPEAIPALGLSLDVLEDEQGRPLSLAPGALDLTPALALWLEYRGPGRFRLIVEPGQPRRRTPSPPSKACRSNWTPPTGNWCVARPG